MRERRRREKKDVQAFLKKLHSPPNWVAIITVAGALVVCPLLIAAIVVNHWQNTYLAVALLLCVVLFAYTVVVVISSVRKMRAKVLDVADRYEFTRNLRDDYRFRTVFFSVCTFLGNVGYTAFLILTAFRYHSVWYGAVGVYYILLCLSRGVLLFQSRKDEKRYRYDFLKLQEAKLGTYRYCGIMMLTLTLSLTLSVVELVFSGSGFRHAVWAIFIFGSVALYKACMAIFHFIRSTKMDDLVMRSVRYVNFAVTLMSLLCMQTSLLAMLPVSGKLVTLFNGITGAVVCAITLALGIYMLAFAKRAKGNLRAQREELAKQWGGEDLIGYNRDGYRDEY